MSTASDRRKVKPEVQAYYDALCPEDKAELDRKMIDARRTLADLRIAKSTGKLDERLLVPKVVIPNPSTTGHHRDEDDVGGDVLDELRNGSKSLGLRNTGTLKGKDLAKYIREELGDGKALADFYIDLLSMTGKEARKAGIYMNHKLMAAAWLGDRGWGRAKGDDDSQKAITINIVDYSTAHPPEAPKKAITFSEGDEKQAVVIDSDAGLDRPILMDNGGTIKIPEVSDEKEIVVEDFSLAEETKR